MSYQSFRRRYEDKVQELEYPDEGCEFSPTCLSCPLPKCRYDYPQGVARMLDAWAKLKPYIDGGMSIPEAARITGIPQRTAYHIKARAAAMNL